MYSIKNFSLKDMVEVSAALRMMGTGKTSMEETADAIIHFLFDIFSNNETDEKDFILIRFFKTHPYGDLEKKLQDYVDSEYGNLHKSPAMKCHILLASMGILPEWQSREQSKDHKAIPLPSEHFVEKFPMIRHLIQQLGMEIKTVLKPDPIIIQDLAKTTFNVFFVPEAVGNPFVPEQDRFVIPFGVKSVLGFGGMLASGNLFSIIIFSKVPIPDQTAELFKTLAINVKLAIFPFDNNLVFSRTQNEIHEWDSSHISARTLIEPISLLEFNKSILSELLTVQEDVVREQSVLLEKIIQDLEREKIESTYIQKRMREGEEKYRTLIENLPQKIFLKDVDSVYISCNKLYADDLNIHSDDIKGKTDYDFFPQELAEKYRSDDKQLVASGEGIEVEEQYFLDGNEYWVNTVKRPVKDANGNIIGLLGIFWDISEKKISHEELRKSEQMLSNILANFPGVVFWKDRNSVYLGCNKNFSDGAGLKDPSEIVGTTDFDLPWAKAEAEWYRTCDREVMDSGKSKLHIIETQLQTDEQIVWFDTNKVPLFDRDKNIIGILGTSNDITELKQVEMELRDTQDQLIQKEKLVVLGKLAGGVGHELRNPLGAIKNAAYFLSMVIENPELDVKDTLEIINKEVARSENIINSLLDFARPKPPVLRMIQVNNVIMEALKENAIPENVTVVFNCNTSLPQIMADPEKLLFIIGVFISNSCHAMPDGGTLTITTVLLDPDWLNICVTDTGVGISEESMKHLFEPLFTTKMKGIGLGLVVAKIIIEAHHGIIHIRSEAGKGTTITMNLPIGITRGTHEHSDC